MAFVRFQIDRSPDWPVLRAIGVTESSDFTDWTPKRLVFAADERDGSPWTQPYGLTVFPYGDVLVGLMPMLVLDRYRNPEHPRYFNNSVGSMHNQMMVSRDGSKWERVADRAPLLQAVPGAWDGVRVYPGAGVVPYGDEVLHYYGGNTSRHGESGQRDDEQRGIGLAIFEADRFVSVEALTSAEPAQVTTTTFLRPEGTLQVNADLTRGPLEVEALGASGHPLPGCAGADCTLSAEGRLRHTIRWSAAGPAAGQPMALRFTQRGARLFAYQFVS